MGLTVEETLRARADHDNEAAASLAAYYGLSSLDRAAVNRIVALCLRAQEDALLADLERVAEVHTTEVLKQLKRDKRLEVVDRPGRGVKP